MHDETPTADSAQGWLSIQQWLQRERSKMTDEYLTNFRLAWLGSDGAEDQDRELPARKGRPRTLIPEIAMPYIEYDQLMRKNDGGVSIAVPGTSVVLQLDGNGNLTILGGGREHIEVN